MNLKQFKTLSEDKQHRKLLLNGACIADRNIENGYILLFQIHSFYVEVFFNDDGHEVIKTRSFENTDELEPYLKQVDLTELF